MTMTIFIEIFPRLISFSSAHATPFHQYSWMSNKILRISAEGQRQTGRHNQTNKQNRQQNRWQRYKLKDKRKKKKPYMQKTRKTLILMTKTIERKSGVEERS